MDNDTYLKDRVGPVAAVLLDAEDEIHSTVAAHRLHEPPERTIRPLGKQEQVRRVGDRRPRCLQEVVVGAEGEEAVDALDEGALEDGPLPAKERHHHQRRHQPVHHQQPRHLHLAAAAPAFQLPSPGAEGVLIDPVRGTAADRRKQSTNLL
jgi:hypothetical protein